MLFNCGVVYLYVIKETMTNFLNKCLKTKFIVLWNVAEALGNPKDITRNSKRCPLYVLKVVLWVSAELTLIW